MNAFGFVRGSDLIFCLVSAEARNGTFICEVSNLNPNTDEIFHETRIAERCTVVDKHAVRVVRRLSGGEGERDSRDEVWVKVEKVLSGQACLSSAQIKFRNGEGGGWEIIPFASEKASLLNTFPCDDVSASEALWFQSSQCRQIDTETLLMVASSVMANARLSPGIRVNATVVYMYKCIELKKQLSHEVFREIFQRSRGITYSIGRDRSSKRDGVLLRLSLETAAWHYCILAGWASELEGILEVVASFDSSTEETPLYALNYSSALVISLILCVRRGDMEVANVLSTKVVEVFYHAVSLRAPVSGWFVDYGVLHENALNAMRMGESLLSKGTISEALIDRSLRSCLRVTGDEFVKVAGEFLSERS